MMAKKGMARPDWTKLHPKNTESPVPQIQGKAKSGKTPARPIVAGTGGSDQKVWHTDRPVSKAHREIGSNPARDNPKNDIPVADPPDL